MIQIKDYDLFIFDLDGTIINTEIYHHIAWNKALTQYLNNKIEIIYSEYCKHLKTEHNITDPKIFEIKNNIYQDYIKNINIDFIGNCKNFIETIINNNKKFVIVTNTPKSNADILIKKYHF